MSDPRRVLIRHYAGNIMFNTLGSLAADGRAGLLLVDFTNDRRLRLTGAAAIHWDPAMTAAFDHAERVVDLELEAVIETVPA
jgi:hypothetical protein